MSSYLLISTFTLTLLLTILSIGVFFSFRILTFPDLTCDGTFPLGAAISALAITMGIHPIPAIILSVIGGAIAGYFVGILSMNFKVPGVVSSILVMTGLYSINLFLLQKPNLSIYEYETVFSKFSDLLGDLLSGFAYSREISAILLLSIILLLIIVFLAVFLNTRSGLKIQIAGDSSKTALIQGININIWTCIGLCLSHSVIALSGSLFAQYQKFADVNSGIGMVVIGLAAVFIGDALETTFLKRKNLLFSLIFVFVGTLIYRYVLSLVLSLGIDNTFTNILTSALVLLSILLPKIRADIKSVFRVW